MLNKICLVLNLEIPRTMAKLVEKQTGQKIKIDADFTKGLEYV